MYYTSAKCRIYYNDLSIMLYKLHKRLQRKFMHAKNIGANKRGPDALLMFDECGGIVTYTYRDHP